MHKKIKKLAVAAVAAAGIIFAGNMLPADWNAALGIRIEAKADTIYDSMVGQCIADFDLTDFYDLTPPSYNTYYPWECVWYVCGRVEEKAGRKIPEIRGLGNGAQWFDRTSLATGAEIVSNSIVCYGPKTTNKYGHVVYVEYVEGDTVYYTEANVDGGKSDEKRSPSDGVLKKCTKEDLMRPSNYQGCIYVDQFVTGELLVGEDGQWHFYKDGEINTSYTGLARNEYGWWYITKGEIDWDYTGMANNMYGWWYVSNGTIDWNYTGMAYNEYGWWYMTNGALNWSYTGMAMNEYGWWYMTNGALNWNYTGMAVNEYGWWYMTNGALDFAYTGMAMNEYGWWYMTNGALDLTYTGMAHNEYGWWYITNGALDLTYTGIGHNEYGNWYYKGGSIASDFTGEVELGSETYLVTNGAASKAIAK